MIDYEQDRVQSVTQTDAAKTLSDKVIELKDLEDEIENAEESLSKLKEKARYISQIEVPQMMEEMHITKLKLKDGDAVEIKKIYGASITLDNQEQAFTWLRNNGLGDIIKNDVTVTFGRGEDNKAQQYAVLARGQGYEPVQKIGVHSQTLKAVVRERLESGQEMPSDLFKTYAGNSTKITRRK
jgi:co-chaperonin GroES (HSP10)